MFSDSTARPAPVGPARDRVPLVAIVGSTGSSSDAIEEAAEQHAAVVRAFKQKVGLGSLAADLDCLCALRKTVGEDRFIAADTNMAWDVDTAGCLASPDSPRFAGSARVLAILYRKG